MQRVWTMRGNTLLIVGGVLLLGNIINAQDECHPNPCGTNAQCMPRGGRPVCVCLPGYWGKPLTYCQRGECSESSDCGGNRICKDYKCVDVCAGQCGNNALCTGKGHIPVCSCPAGYTGDPFTHCRPFNPRELCEPSPCGRNTNCDITNGVPTCSCLPGYIGDPLSGCHHECETDRDCGSHSKCSSFKCTQVCTATVCAHNARCDVSNHKAVCTCPSGTFGDPYSSCNMECESHYHCPSGRSACLRGKCVDPCAGQCGVNANCRVRDRTTPVCSCPRDMTGDPFISCRPFEKADLCIPNPCGLNAQCTPGNDISGNERPVCTCLPGYLGDALSSCRQGECSSDRECSYDKSCINYTCRPICDGTACGHGATCTARDHAAVCTCPPGTTGLPLTSCKPIPRPVAAESRNGRLYYLRK